MFTEEDALAKIVEMRLAGIKREYDEDGHAGILCDGHCNQRANEESPLSENDISIIMTGACSDCWFSTLP